MAHGVNSNLARRWVLEAERRDGGAFATTASSTVPTGFVAVQLPRTEVAPADIRIELRCGTTAISVSWPCAAALECPPCQTSSAFHQTRYISSHPKVELVPAKHDRRRIDLGNAFEDAVFQFVLGGDAYVPKKGASHF